MYLSFVKPLFDRLLALVLLLCLSPFLLFLFFIIRLESKGSPLFTQVRVGLNGKAFRMYKLRSMCLGADKDGPYFTSKNDSRITKVGQFIRKTSLDEIPQLVNIIFGDMSFIGPRPDVPVQEANYTPEQWQKRLSVKPGITGLAQSTKRSSATHEERISLDLEYVNRVNLLLDFEILLRTFQIVLFAKSSH